MGDGGSGGSHSRLIDELCDQFEQQLTEGRDAKIEAFLDQVPTESRAAALKALLEVELERCQSGTSPPVFADYQARFPDLQSAIESAFNSVNAALGLNDDTVLADSAAVASHEIGSDEVSSRVRYFGEYELVEEIARGGMGIVYKARQAKLNRIVALKMILAGELASPEDVKRFHAEAEAAANLQHANIVAIHEVGEHNGHHYFSMDFIDGTSLAERVRLNPLGFQKAAEYVKSIAEAIDYAHRQGVLHRDLKPSNVLVDQSGQPIVTDFGLAKRIEGDSTLTASGAILGTPSYMPPEQATGRHHLIGPASDVYALGAILYELVTGRPPFRAETPLETLIQVQEQEPVSPRLLNGSIPHDLATICLKCLEKRISARYQTAKELGDDLGHFLNHEPIVARPAGSLRRLWGWSRRRPWVVTAVASLVVVGLSGLAYYFWVENAFLRWSATHADYKKKPGAFTSAYDFTAGIATGLNLALMAAFGYFAQYAKKCKVEDHSISLRLLAAHGVFGLVGVLFGILTGMNAIEAYVWESRSLLSAIIPVYLCCNFGSLIILRTVREYESVTFGDPSEARDVDRETLDDIERVFLNNDVPNSFLEALDDTEREMHSLDQWPYVENMSGKQVIAQRIYRAATGATHREAEIAVERIHRELHLKYPDRVPPIKETFRWFEDVTNWRRVFVKSVALWGFVGFAIGMSILVGVGLMSLAGGPTQSLSLNETGALLLLTAILTVVFGIAGAVAVGIRRSVYWTKDRLVDVHADSVGSGVHLGNGDGPPTADESSGASG